MRPHCSCIRRSWSGTYISPLMLMGRTKPRREPSSWRFTPLRSKCTTRRRTTRSLRLVESSENKWRCLTLKIVRKYTMRRMKFAQQSHIRESWVSSKSVAVKCGWENVSALSLKPRSCWLATRAMESSIHGFLRIVQKLRQSWIAAEDTSFEIPCACKYAHWKCSESFR